MKEAALRYLQSTVMVCFCLMLAGCSSGQSDPVSAPVDGAAQTATVAPEPTTTTAPTVTSAPTATVEPAATPLPEPTSDPIPTVVVPSEPLYELEGEVPLSVMQINEMVLFVEVEAGRPFLFPPRIRVQSPQDFFAELTVETLPDEYRQFEVLNARRTQALGLTTQGVAESIEATVAGGVQLVAGYYVSSEDRIYAPWGQGSLEFFADTLVHELVHALDDQYVDLGRSRSLFEEGSETGNYEAFNIAKHVIEGRATLVEKSWSWPAHWGTPPEFEPRPQPTPDAELSPAPAAAPDVAIAQLLSPYRFGPAFIRARGGAASTWDLLESPPETTEEILVPAAVDQVVVPVAIPQADGPVLDTGYVGALDLGFLLHGRSSPVTLAGGWAGGASVLWGDDTETCFRAAVATDTIEDRNRLFGAFERWADLLDGRNVVIEDDLVVATACAPYIP